MKNQKITETTWFKNVVIIAILFIPFLYSFFYLKAYWDPYGEGNMDNIPVAIVNEDKGDKGKSLVDKLIDSKVLKFNITSKAEAKTGLNNKKYYAVISIPSDFTNNLKSANEDEKIPATITYSPNQKTNYLASQIISRVVLTVEKEVRSEVSETVVKNLSDKLIQVPKKLEDIENGSEKLEKGSITLTNGLKTLSSKYDEFNAGVNKIYAGSENLTNGINQVNNGLLSLQDGSKNLNSGVKQINDALSNTNTENINLLTNGITSLNDGANSLNNGVSSYVNGSEQLANGIVTFNETLNNLKLYYQNLYQSELLKGEGADTSLLNQYGSAVQTLNTILSNDGYNQIVNGSNKIVDTTTYGVTSGTILKSGASSLYEGTNMLNNSTSQIQSIGSNLELLKNNLKKIENGTENLENGVNTLKTGNNQVLNGSNTLTNGMLTLKQSSNEVKNGIDKLDSGSMELSNGITTLKEEVKKGNESTKNELKKLDGLDKFTANPIEIKEKDINKVNSYGTAFAPFFISIALWVGSLMLFIILYYDASDRFKILSRNADNKLKRTIAYILLAALQGITLGILLMIGLDFTITNYFLYFISLIIVACLFESIMELLMTTFGDIGKFISLILLVLQLAAAGGTFPIQTVTKGFRWLYNFLPMRYTCDLFKESLVTIEGNLLSNSLIIILILLVLFISINIFKDLRKKDK